MKDGLEQAISWTLTPKQREYAIQYRNKHGKAIELEELYKIK